MEIKELLEKQKKLDAEILSNFIENVQGACYGSLKQSDFLTEKLLSLQVEVSELANATRCFKYWSVKGPEPKEKMLDEYADIIHFLLSVGNALEFTAEEIEQAYLKKHEENYRRQREGY